MLTSLTTIKFSKYVGQKGDTEFLEYMLVIARVLKTIIIAWEKLIPQKKKCGCVHSFLVLQVLPRVVKSVFFLLVLRLLVVKQQL